MFRERFMVDAEGSRVGVLLNLKDWRRSLQELDELESVRAYDAAKASEDEMVPFERAVAQIERQSYSNRSGCVQMKTSRQRYVVDGAGRNVAVIVPMRECQRLLGNLHHLAVAAERRAEKPIEIEEGKRLVRRKTFRKRRVSG